METLQPTLRLGRDVWNHDAMPLKEFRQRADRLRAAMAKHDLDALLLYGSNLNDCGHPTYVSNYIVKLPFAALVALPRDGDAALVFQGATRGRSAAQATTWIKDVRPCWNIAETCVAILGERGLMNARLGLAALPRLMPHHDWTTLAKGLASATLVDAEEVVNRLRAIKSEREVGQIDQASRIVRRAMSSVAGRAPAAGEWRLVAHVMREARAAGAEDMRLMIARPREPDWAFRPVEDVACREDDIVVVLLAASWERYWSQSIRTFRVVGDRFDDVAASELGERFSAMTSGLKAGVTVGQWSRATLAAMTPAERSAIARYGFGDGIGITPSEWPSLSRDDETMIERGMCVTVGGAFEWHGAVALHGDTIVL